jgi:transposase
MTEELTVTTERVDDVPVLMAQAQKMGLAELLDHHFPTHGNWEGVSLGWTLTVWLTHVLSEGDHRLNQVESWVEKRLHTLQLSTGQPVRPPAWSDDRLGLGLDALSESENWRAFERALNQRTVRVYNLNRSRVRVDSTTVSGYWTVTEDGLFQFGHSKDHRPDLPQLKVMLSTLDPLGLPLATQVISGERADDPLYIPAIQQVSASLAEHGLLYIGDCKMAASGTRAFIQAQDDYYLCPLSEKQLPQAVLGSYLTSVWQQEQALTAVTRTTLAGKTETLAEGYEPGARRANRDLDRTAPGAPVAAAGPGGRSRIADASAPGRSGTGAVE